jgi:hypothetical protein
MISLGGGPNDDTFVFNVGSGNVTINDFNRGNSAVGSTATEHDIINLQDYHFADWGHPAGHAIIQLSATDSVTLLGVDLIGLQQTDFII